MEPGSAADRGLARAPVRAGTEEGFDMAYQGAASVRPDVPIELPAPRTPSVLGPPPPGPDCDSPGRGDRQVT